MLRESFNNALDNFEFNIIAICVMQNHLHMILKLKNIKEYPKIIYSIKFYFSHRLNKNNKISESKLKKGEKGIWQRRYWEHTIRDEKYSLQFYEALSNSSKKLEIFNIFEIR